MLTKTDLQAIDKLVSKRIREEIEAEGRNIRDELKSDIISSRIRIQQEIRDLADRIKNLEIRINSLGKDIKKDFQKLNTLVQSRPEWEYCYNQPVESRVLFGAIFQQH